MQLAGAYGLSTSWPQPLGLASSTSGTGCCAAGSGSDRSLACAGTMQDQLTCHRLPASLYCSTNACSSNDGSSNNRNNRSRSRSRSRSHLPLQYLGTLASHHHQHEPLLPPIALMTYHGFTAQQRQFAAHADITAQSSSNRSNSGSIQGSSSSSSSSTGSSTAASTVPAGMDPALGFVRGGYTVEMFPAERIRNFCIIAHVDHGKSTLADRLMEMTGALQRGKVHQAQYLDKLQVERDRGITVKAQTVSLVYRHSDGHTYLINLIDTPGHVDFVYEVSRSLAACQGALLLVDAGQGVQAQTVANWRLAVDQGLQVVYALNKIDLPQADAEMVLREMEGACGLTEPSTALRVSAKTGQGLPSVLPTIIERVPPPRGDPSAPLRLLLFDAFHDAFRGVVVLVEVVDGCVTAGQTLLSCASGQAWEVAEVGVLAPERHPTGKLLTGQVGYIVTGSKDLRAVRVGDTWKAAPSPGQAASEVQALPGFRPARPLVYAGLYPLSAQSFDALDVAMERLTLNDASVSVKRENSEALGPGFRCGFLGMLHMEVFMSRLEQEHGASVVTTTPTVPYLLDMGPGEDALEISRASDFPLQRKVHSILEPTVTATIITPSEYVGRVMTLCSERRGMLLDHTLLGALTSTTSSQEHSVAGDGQESSSVGSSSSSSSSSSQLQPVSMGAEGEEVQGGKPVLGGVRAMLRYSLPLSELMVGGMHSELKSRTQGYASFDYEEGEMREADLVRLDVLAHGKTVDTLARLVHRQDAPFVGRALLNKMKELLDRQQFEVVLQAACNGRVVARETLRALRKDVTAKCYGGDVSRKRKLLDRQKEGKARMKRLGSIDVPASAFPELMKVSHR